MIPFVSRKYEFLSQSSAFLIFFLSPSLLSKHRFNSISTYRVSFFSWTKSEKVMKKLIRFIKFWNEMLFAENTRRFFTFFSPRACILNIFHIFSSSTFRTTPCWCQKSIINYIHLLFREIWKKQQNTKLFWFAFALPLRCCCRDLHFSALLFVLFSLTAKGEYNRRLFTYLCLFLFVFNYHVMSRGLERYSNSVTAFYQPHWAAFAFILKNSFAREANQEHYRLCPALNTSRKIEIYIFFHFLSSQFSRTLANGKCLM